MILLSWLLGCGQVQCGTGTHLEEGFCVADPCPVCPEDSAKKKKKKKKKKAKGKGAKGKGKSKLPPPPEFDGTTSASFNFAKSQQKVQIKAGTFFDVTLGAPLGVKEEYRYTWARPITRGKVQYVRTDTTEVDQPNGTRATAYRVIFYAREPGIGAVRINRKYEVPSRDPAPDFGIPVEVIE